MNGTLISADNSWALFGVLACVASAAIYLEQHYRWAAKMTGCVLALIGSMLLTNLHIIPTESSAYDVVWNYAVPLAIPMLLFQADIRKIGRRSGRLIIVFLIGGVGTVLGGLLAYRLLRPWIPDLARAVPMMIGTYTGGSVNLVAMADNYHAKANLVSAAVVADNLVMVIYFFVLMAIPEGMSRFSRRRRPISPVNEVRTHGTVPGTAVRADGPDKASAASPENEKKSGGAGSYWKPKKVSLQDIAAVFAVSAFVVAVSSTLAGWFSSVIPKDGFLMTLLNGFLGNQYLLITTLTMVLATLFPKKIGRLAGAEEIGTYLIHVFFAVIGVPASLSLILTKAPLLLVFCMIIVGMNMLFSFVSGWLLRFSNEEIAIASNANIGGPTTAAAMAFARGWEDLIVPAVLTGTLGYVLGNYYGILAGTWIGLR